VVLSERFRRRALAGVTDVAGVVVRLNGRAFTVVGVAPMAFRGLSPLADAPDAWAPIAMYGALTATTHMAWWQRVPQSRSNWLTLVGRLSPGATFEAAEANLQALSAALEYEGRDPEDGILVSRQYLYSPQIASSLAALSFMLLAVVAIVLVVAAANVAVLLLARAGARGRELGIRTALGAGAGRIVRQLLTESLLLGLGGGAVGVALAHLLTGTAATLLPYHFAGPFVPASSVLAAAVVLSLLTAVCVGLAPAVFSLRTDVVRVIGSGGAGQARSRLRDGLVVGQVALSLVLVAAAVLFGRSFTAARSEPIGWRADHRLVLGVDLRSQGYDETRGRAFIQEGLERIAALPGVTAASAARMVPFQGDWSTDFTPEPERFPDAPEGPVWIGLNAVAPGYFDLMGIDILEGRPLGRADVAGAMPAVVVNETLARTLWPGQPALGEALPDSFFPGANDGFTVVGVARDVTYYQLGERSVAQAYSSAAQAYSADMNFLIATTEEPAAGAAAAQAALRAIDRNIAFGQVTTLDAVYEEQVARYRISAVLVGLFSAIALLLAATGLYGVVSFLVARRTRDIGVRMALGAPASRVAGEVLGGVARLTGAGVALGVAGALALRRFTEGLLYGVAPQDPWALVGAVATLAAVMLLAALVPARRAMRVDPARAIRSD
jgi:predicted permease